METITKKDSNIVVVENTTSIKHEYKRKWLVEEIARLQAILNVLNK